MPGKCTLPQCLPPKTGRDGYPHVPSVRRRRRIGINISNRFESNNASTSQGKNGRETSQSSHCFLLPRHQSTRDMAVTPKDPEKFRLSERSVGAEATPPPPARLLREREIAGYGRRLPGFETQLPLQPRSVTNNAIKSTPGKAIQRTIQICENNTKIKTKTATQQHSNTIREQRKYRQGGGHVLQRNNRRILHVPTRT